MLYFRYVCILDTLDALYTKSKEPDILGLRMMVTNKQVVATILLLCDILKPVHILSLYLQEENINFSSLPFHVKATNDLLHALIEKYQLGNLATQDVDFAKCDELFAEIDDRTDLGRRTRNDVEAGRMINIDVYLRDTGNILGMRFYLLL